MVSDVSSIICGKCHDKHGAVEQVKLCYGLASQPLQATSTTVRTAAYPHFKPLYVPATSAQVKYLEDLGYNGNARELSKKGASDAIQALQEQKRKNAMTATPNRSKTKVPIPFLMAVGDGRYAVRPDSNTPYTFFRFSRPKTGRFAGTLKIQTQHSEKYELCMAVWPNGTVSVYDFRYEDDLLLVCVDPNGAGIAYGQEIGACMICGKDLTDERSRYFGIGPDCETRHRHIIDLVESQKGPFHLGK